MKKAFSFVCFFLLTSGIVCAMDVDPNALLWSPDEDLKGLLSEARKLYELAAEQYPNAAARPLLHDVLAEALKPHETELDGATALHLAAQRYYPPAIMQAVLALGVDVSAQDGDKWTAVHYLVECICAPGEAYYPEAVKKLELLCAAGINLGKTAPHVVVSGGDREGELVYETHVETAYNTALRLAAGYENHSCRGKHPDVVDRYHKFAQLLARKMRPPGPGCPVVAKHERNCIVN